MSVEYSIETPQTNALVKRIIYIGRRCFLIESNFFMLLDIITSIKLIKQPF